MKQSKPTIPTKPLQNTQSNDKFNSMLLKRKNQTREVEEFDSNSVIFNDQYFTTAQEKFINNKVLPYEQNFAKRGQTRRIYKSLEHLLLDNIQYYNRIIRTLFVLFENRSIQDGKSLGHVENPFKGLSRALYKKKITPTQLYYIALLPPDFTHDEFTLGFPDVEHGIKHKKVLTKQDRITMFTKLGTHNRFKLLYELARISTGSEPGDTYSSILERDKTPYKFLKTIIPYKYQKAINVGFNEQNEESVAFGESYTTFLTMLDYFKETIPDQYVSIRRDSVQFHNFISSIHSCYVLGGNYVIMSSFPFADSVLHSYVRDRPMLEEYACNTEFLEFALSEMLNSKDNIDKFYGIKLLSNGSVSSIRIKRGAGGMAINETTFDNKGNVIYEITCAKVRSVGRAIKIIIHQFHYYVFDINKANVINTNLNSVPDVLNHISEVVTRYQTDSDDIAQKYDVEVERVMKKYIKFVKDKKKL